MNQLTTNRDSSGTQTSGNHPGETDDCPCGDSPSFEYEVEVEYGMTTPCLCDPYGCESAGGPEADVPWEVLVRALAVALDRGVVAGRTGSLATVAPQELLDERSAILRTVERYEKSGDELGASAARRRLPLVDEQIGAEVSGGLSFSGVVGRSLTDQVFGVGPSVCCREGAAVLWGPLRVRRLSGSAARGLWTVDLVVRTLDGVRAVGPVVVGVDVGGGGVGPDCLPA